MRDIKIDLLRFLGLSLIILAHVNPPVWLFQLRNFDVPLMVLVSGLAFVRSKKIESYQNYLWKRIKRLVFPTWLFLTFYFVFMSAIIQVNNLNFQIIIDSYTLIEGIGYVWIIRVFLLVALTAPLILSFNQKIKNNLVYFASLGIIYLGYELLLWFTLPYKNTWWGYLFTIIVYYSIVYSLIFAIGIRIPQLSKFHNLILCLIFMSIFSVLAFSYYKNTGTFVQTQTSKYPPSIYYLSYALGMSILCWLLVDKVAVIIGKLKKLQAFILFIAQNSFWVYLWHVQFLKLFEYYYASFQGLTKSLYVYFPIRYSLIYFASIGITFIQIYIINKIIIPGISKDSVKKNIKILLTG